MNTSLQEMMDRLVNTLYPVKCGVSLLDTLDSHVINLTIQDLRTRTPRVGGGEIVSASITIQLPRGARDYSGFFNSIRNLIMNFSTFLSSRSSTDSTTTTERREITSDFTSREPETARAFTTLSEAIENLAKRVDTIAQAKGSPTSSTTQVFSDRLIYPSKL